MRTPYKLIVLGIASVAILIIASIGFRSFHDSLGLGEFGSLEIRNISIYSLSSQETIKLSQQETSHLIHLLSKINLVGCGTDSFLQYDGVFTKMFFIELEDGTSFDFAACNPFYIINAESGFVSDDYEVCNRLYDTYHSLVAKYFAP